MVRDSRTLNTSLKQADPELFIGLVSATGTDLTIVAKALEERLQEYKYRCEAARLIELLYEIEKWRELPQTPVDDRIKSHMDAGNQFRELVENAAAIALLGVGAVRERRTEFGNATANIPIPRCAYIFRGLKHPDEIEALRDIYGAGFILIGVYSPHDLRLDYLSRRRERASV
jgi:hypothetical protein